MDMINAPEAHAIETGDRRVTVGIMDTGVQATHPDLAANFDADKSRNFTTDILAVDGPCEVASCVDPANVDDNGHGTHVAGTIGAALNGRRLSGVAPGSAWSTSAVARTAATSSSARSRRTHLLG